MQSLEIAYRRSLCFSVIMTSMQVITSSQQVFELCHSLAKHEFVTIDTEFLREKTYYPKLCLVQISSPEKEAYAIDPLAQGMDLSPLFDLLQNPNVLKVLHAGRQDMEIFYNLTGRVPTPFFDTQIAAMVCGYGDSVGYENLVRDISGGKIDKTSQFTDWSIRPLSERQITYALGDVTHLVDVYNSLKDRLAKHNREQWMDCENEILANPATYANDPFKTWERIKIRSPQAKSLCILREIAAWREMQAQTKNIPKTWVMKDETLAEIAGHAPTNQEQLKKIRGISADLAAGKVGEQILACIQTALSKPKSEWPTPEKRVALPPRVSATVDILKMLLKIQCTEHDVAPKLIASQDDIEAIALDDHADVPALKGWRADIFGNDALAVKNGQIAIGLKDGKVIKINIG